MFAAHKSHTEAPMPGLHAERRRMARHEDCPAWIGQRLGTPEEVAELQERLAFDAWQMAELRKRNDQLMAVASDLRCKLGEMTLRWVDSCERKGF